MKPHQHKLRDCRVCKKQFRPTSSLQFACGYKCAIEWGKIKTERRVKKEKQIRKKERVKAKREFRENDRPLQIKLCQQACNWYVKYVQEAGKGCYTCTDPLTTNKADAGHWLTRGAHPEKRFDTVHNLRKQCVNCNRYNGGRPDIFEKNLRAELGDDVVDEFIASKPPKLTTPEVVELKKHFLKLNREARKGME